MRGCAELDELLEVPPARLATDVSRVGVEAVQSLELRGDGAFGDAGHDAVFGVALDVGRHAAEHLAPRLVGGDEVDATRADELIERGHRDARHARA